MMSTMQNCITSPLGPIVLTKYKENSSVDRVHLSSPFNVLAQEPSPHASHVIGTNVLD